MIENRKLLFAKFVKALQLLSYMLAFLITFSPILLNFHPHTHLTIEKSNGILIYVLFSLGTIYFVSSKLSDKHLNFDLPSITNCSIYTLIMSFIICTILCAITWIFFKTFSILSPILFLITTQFIYIPTQLLFNKTYSYINNRLKNKRYVIVVGSNQRAIDFANLADKQKFLGIHVLGFIDNINTPENNLSIIGSFNDFKKIIRENIVDAVVIKLPVRSFYDKITELIDTTEEQGISTYFLDNFFEPKCCEITAFSHGKASSIVFHSAPLEDWKMLLKRTISFLGATIAIILTSPIMILISIAIFIEDPGPVFFTQQRIGYRKRIFTLYKFRTMHKNAHEMHSSLESLNEMDGPVFKIKNDPRITSVGKLLRKFCLDELPQFLNVLSGDMNLVGPRPLALRDYCGFREDWLRRRFSVPPGLTCYWQSMVNRNDLSFEEWMRLDMQYIDNCNLWEDLKICLKTVCTVLAGKGV